MRIEDVDFFYLSMPLIEDIGDGSQDMLLVRVRADGVTGWGECEASPLVSLANWVTPKSHSACKSVRELVIGKTIDGPQDIRRLRDEVAAGGLDIAQTDHTFSGLEIALWDWLGRRSGQPVHRLLGQDVACPKRPYASCLFGRTPEETGQKARQLRQSGYTAIKFGWGSYGRDPVELDAEHVAAARDGTGKEGILMIDAGTVWGDNVSAARDRIPALLEHDVFWLEEPFVGDALEAYCALHESAEGLPVAGGEGAFNFHMARHLIDYGQVDFIQIDTGRIGGIGPSCAVADYAADHGVTFVNHTFTTQLALSASLACFLGRPEWTICEYPVEASSLATELFPALLVPGEDGLIQVPDLPGLGVSPNLDVMSRYLVEVEIKVAGKVLYRTPEPGRG